jgi:hypothetical protein
MRILGIETSADDPAQNFGLVGNIQEIIRIAHRITFSFQNNPGASRRYKAEVGSWARRSYSNVNFCILT